MITLPNTVRGQSGTSYRLGAQRSGGQAWVCQSERGGQKVAVKIAKEVGHNARVEAEYVELSRLLAEHPALSEHLVRPIDRGTVNATEVDHQGQVQTVELSFLVLERWYDRDLAAWLKSKPGLLDRARAAFAAAEAVSQLHFAGSSRREGVVHRDIKPSNLLVVDGPGPLRLMLADFGGARRVGGDRGASTQSGFHTEGYAPVEQTLPLRADADFSWDVYALAVTAFECLTGERPLSTTEHHFHLSKDGQRLRTLAARRSNSGRLSESDEAAYRELVGKGLAAVSKLIELDKMEALTEADARALTDILSPPIPADQVGFIGGQLVQVIKDALHPDPGKRQPDPRYLRSALQALVRSLEQAQLRSPDPPRDTPPPDSVDWKTKRREAPPPPPSPVPSLRTPLLLGAVVAGGALGLLVTLTGIGFYALRRGPTAEGAVTATPAQLEVPIRDPIPMVAVASRPGLLLAETETTQAQWAALIHSAEQPNRDRSWEKGPCADAGVGPTLPVTCLSWREAAAFCNALTEEVNGGLPAGARKLSLAYAEAADGGWEPVPDATGYRLPTLTEWQAAAGGPTSPWPADDSGEAYAWFGDHPELKSRQLQPVKGRKALLGLYDLGGNANEWLEDSPAPGQRLSIGGDVLRAKEKAALNASSARDETRPHWMVGFRVARTAPKVNEQTPPDHPQNPPG